jgi:hypothetical protein
MLAVLTQKPPFSTGNLRLLTSAATLEVALEEEPQASHSENGNQPKQRTRGSGIIATGSVCGERPMHAGALRQSQGEGTKLVSRDRIRIGLQWS